MHFSPVLVVAFVGLSTAVYCTPIQVASKSASFPRGQTHSYDNCNSKQQSAIYVTLREAATLAGAGYDLLVDGDRWKENKGYTHYFKDTDMERVKKAWDVLRWTATASDLVSFNIKCASAKDPDCKASDVGYTDPTEETLPPVGRRVITLCPKFFERKEAKRHLPTKYEELQKYCWNHKGKHINDFETGGDALLHEITHIDDFGVKAGFPRVQGKGENLFFYHGTVDWNDQSTAWNARQLKETDTNGETESWQNASSLSASALEIFVMKVCGDTDIGP